MSKVQTRDRLGPGLLLSFSLALIAFWLGQLFPLVGGPVFGILLGILLSNTIGLPANSLPGIAFSSKKILQWAIIVLGAGLSLEQVLKTGSESFVVMTLTLAAAFLAAYGFGHFLHISFDLKTLIGVGTAICGGSAIAAVAPILQADDKDISYAMSAIFLFNIVAVLVFPPLGHALGFSDQAFGLWAGTAINDTSSVVAAGYAFSKQAGEYATIVKLTRTTLILPIALFFTFWSASRKKHSLQETSLGQHRLKKVFPWFVLWFLVASVLNTLGVFRPIEPWIHPFGKFLIILALCAVGLKTDFKEMRKSGLKPLLLGLGVWAVVALTSVAVQHWTGQI